MKIEPLVSPSTAELKAALQSCETARSGGKPTRLVECAFGDFTSVARGKLVHADDFTGMGGCRAPSVVMGLTLTAGEPEAVFGPLLPDSYDDMHLVPDLRTLSARPGRPGELTVLCEPTGALRSATGMVDASAYSPRAALRAVLARLDAAGLQALVAPELELFLLDRDAQARLSAARAHGGSLTRERACEALSLERLSHFEAYFDELYAACDLLGIPVNGHAHESALSQYEVNFRHGEPLAQADAVFRFKRLAREIAARHGYLCSFAPKPFLDEPGTGMHWHFSVQRQAADWPHLFAEPAGADSAALAHFVGGLQRAAPAAMAFFSPHDMGYDRIALSNASPSHASWGHEDRSLAFRIPASGASARRIENRLPGGDANPYLTVAATLGLGLLGLQAAEPPMDDSDELLRLPRSLPTALDALHASQALRELLGDPLVNAFIAIKRHEHAERAALAQPREQWDLTHLLELG
ncbi:glutamine synthetase family protein [Ideonella azotifigens]|uniref:Glutamine synthetase family protein n=1 Tax=Ideonella azotifigens TaxID=513160 RepID=A0ABN1JZW0_9BURK|nr:glutamine synthetase family protein [Ideonella azotifigens]MCD2342575.1 glutamine synthetase family protein [Ideonella azotifigens]